MTTRHTGHYVTTTVAGESVQAFVPDALPPRLTKAELPGLTEPLRRAEAALAQLDLAGAMIPSLDWFVYAFVRREALLSSEIEGTQATLQDVLSWEQTAQPGASGIEDVEEVTNYVAAINHAFEQIRSPRGTPISVRLLNDCHRILMHGVRGASKQPGELRRSQNWIGGASPGDATFVPPPPTHVADLLSGLERYIHSDDDLPPLIRAGLVHVQFETIHPYLDGNGRLGRMVIALLLEHWEVLGGPLLYLSLYFRQNQTEYYRRLDSIRTEGDWIGWLAFFLTGVSEIADDVTRTTRALYARVTEDRQTLLAMPEATVSSVRLFELLPEHPVITMPLVTDLLSTTKPTAGKAIDVLSEAGILSEIGERKRDRLYRYDGYLRLLE
ncbi:Fic family protein [Lentisalinibacter sediminis]|uniref:Fic family protein n=1 Tax=Lentisalinibacter sediminis TaxID=2992237 RepID=UPI0038705F2A